MLSFFGRGSAFRPQQNSAFYKNGKNLFLIDCPMSSFFRLTELAGSKEIDITDIEMITIMVTHTHGDHVGGIPMLIHYAFYVWQTPVRVAAPSPEVAADLKYLFDKLEGCDTAAYQLVEADTLTGTVTQVIPTSHVPELSGKCFGYALNIAGKNIIYTGDTNTLEPYKPYITPETILYTEASTLRSPVHLYLEDILDYLVSIASEGTQVYLMHIDNEEAASKLIDGTAIKLAPLA